MNVQVHTMLGTGVMVNRANKVPKSFYTYQGGQLITKASKCHRGAKRRL
jgi:hypothetical protein